MGRLYDAGMTLLMSVLAFVQLVVFGVLATVYVPLLVIVGVINVIYKMIFGMSFENINLLTEPIWWAAHQVGVLFGAKDNFAAAPYISEY